MLLLACTTPPDDDAAAAPSTYAVGHVEAEVSYTDPEGNPRALRTAAWYPASGEGNGPAQYLYGTIESEGASESAPAAEGEFPVVAFSHGHQGFAELSSFLMEHLASRGFVVLAPDHANNTTFDGGDRSTAIYLQRPFDLSAVIDAQEAGLFPGLPATTGQVVAMGHSFGGYTIFASGGAAYDTGEIEAACEAGTGGSVCSDWSADWVSRFDAGGRDGRVLGIVAMAPGNYWMFEDNLQGLAVPTLLMTGAVDPERDADGASYWAALSPPLSETNGACGGCEHHWVDIATAGHNAFTDFSGSLDDGGTIEPGRGWDIVNAYALALARFATGDDHALDVLRGEAAVDDLATVE
ncbi:MAG: hypothetical protein FJ090_02460 [Deltaproteobacteria bacterium]|nr:hypothetical protein [Deltaproteobacteria bacterium]